jgi:hypothetical protein
MARLEEAVADDSLTEALLAEALPSNGQRELKAAEWRRRASAR